VKAGSDFGKKSAMMKSILSLVLTISMILLGAAAKAETNVAQRNSHSYEDSCPQINGDYLIWNGFNDGQWGAFLLEGSETRAMSECSDPVLYLSNVYGLTVLPSTVHDGEEVDAWALMLAGKLSKSGNVSPFITVGAGVMPTNLNAKTSVTVPSSGFSRSFSESDSDTKACGKLGVGIDYFATRNVSLGFEGSYVFGLGDFAFDLGFLGDREMDILYFIFTLGAAYHF
jgi:opacity protein-like surface antigen